MNTMRKHSPNEYDGMPVHLTIDLVHYPCNTGEICISGTGKVVEFDAFDVYVEIAPFEAYVSKSTVADVRKNGCQNFKFNFKIRVECERSLFLSIRHLEIPTISEPDVGQKPELDTEDDYRVVINVGHLKVPVKKSLFGDVNTRLVFITPWQFTHKLNTFI